MQRIYESVIAYCNNAFVKLYGFEHYQKVIGKHFSEISVTRTQSLIEVFTQFIRSGYNIVEQEIYEIEASGKGHWFLIDAHGVIEEGNLVHIWGSQRNISERKNL